MLNRARRAREKIPSDFPLCFETVRKKESEILQHEPHGNGFAENTHHARFAFSADINRGIGGV